MTAEAEMIFYIRGTQLRVPRLFALAPTGEGRRFSERIQMMQATGIDDDAPSDHVIAVGKLRRCNGEDYQPLTGAIQALQSQ